MASNYFSKPFGLQPTPAACFPPPTPGPGTDITGLVGYSPQPISVGRFGVFLWNFSNVTRPPGEPISVVWTTPGIASQPPGPFANGIPGSHGAEATGPAGSYSASAVVTWANGQVRTYPFAYTIDP